MRCDFGICYFFFHFLGKPKQCAVLLQFFLLFSRHFKQGFICLVLGVGSENKNKLYVVVNLRGFFFLEKKARVLILVDNFGN